MRFTVEQHTALNDAMDFDHVITIDDDAAIHHGASVLGGENHVPIWAPEVYVENPEADLTPFVSAGWSLMNGYSGQWQYSGPIMHASEYVGGKLADDILSEPGVYCLVVVPDLSADSDNGEDTDMGWAVARLR